MALPLGAPDVSCSHIGSYTIYTIGVSFPETPGEKRKESLQGTPLSMEIVAAA